MPELNTCETTYVRQDRRRETGMTYSDTYDVLVADVATEPKKL